MAGRRFPLEKRRATHSVAVAKATLVMTGGHFPADEPVELRKSLVGQSSQQGEAPVLWTST